MIARTLVRATAACTVLLSALSLGGCGTRYMTPGGPADFRALGITPQHADAITDASIALKMSRQPAASFPATIVVVRVQAPGYQNFKSRDSGVYGAGNASVVTVRDVEQDVDMAELRALPMVRGISTVNRFIIPSRIQSDLDIRSIAAELHGDIVFAYTFDTKFRTDTVVPALGFFTLGLFPSESAEVTSTCSGVFVDTRTGYIYGLVEATDDTSQLANKWTSTDAVEQSRNRVERRAFKKMVESATATWRSIAATYGPPAAAMLPAGVR